MKKLMLLSLMVATNVMAGLSQDFGAQVARTCPKIKGLKEKKVLFNFIGKQKSGENPCEDKFLLQLLKPCGAPGKACAELYTSFTDILERTKGNVVGDK